MAERFPIFLIEDGLAEDDWDGWSELTARLGDRLQLVSDDILVTNPAIITEAIARGVGNAALIKLDQIGTVTETLAAIGCPGDVPGHFRDEISHFFDIYKVLEPGQGTDVPGWPGRQAAEEVIAASVAVQRGARAP